ncbi:MAG: SAM-dependent methyltransferase [Pseudomonadota bacterium]|nr:MAG: SAM-dependent methyltransferase [Pseudomonadota bacterium]
MASAVASNQDDIHPRLVSIVRRHMATRWRQPIRAHTRQAFEQLALGIDVSQPVILDSGCGTGWSTVRLARVHPEAVVVGVDKSEVRLQRHPHLPDNARLVRAELADLWRLIRARGWPVSRHCLFYPNPWPKAAHIGRRWHAHPVFPILLQLGGELELRTNFEIYAREFARALALAGTVDVRVVSFVPDEPVSPFERKYAQRGHRLFKIHADLEEVQR